MAADGKTPVTVLTGFLGSGKTSLLRLVLAEPDFADTAVIINEAGEMALDHLLVEAVDEQVVEMPSGCLCCVRRLDIVTTVRSLIDRRDRGELRSFSRIVIETSGLADPAPILYTLAADPMLGHVLSFRAVVTLVDAVAGEGTLQRHPEAASQVAVADRILVTKSDLLAPAASLFAMLDGLNAWAERISLPGDDDLGELLFGAVPAVATRSRFTAQAVQPQAAHTVGITTLSLVLTQPLTRLDLAKSLGRLASDRGEDLLRVKGLVAFADRPGHVAVIHAVQHTIYRPEWLQNWPGDDRRNRLVFVVRDIAPEVIMGHFAVGGPVHWTPDLIGAAA
ncbi:GTP-binding protein [Acidisoma cellulosilytica]|uniref:GTP-binding protein n=1 Tax=Acidisoma cellulosilyticum TaxID=2802395 RepID=A0A964E5J5_9PROT|nr:GTP-binding protein [Acidisoma cellulosilyticum]MCB8882586.1 GTP-binding protein [Acidisoma cellulosilyticum]